MQTVDDATCEVVPIELSPLTRWLIGYWLRGLRKGFGVDLDDVRMDVFDARMNGQVEWEQTIRELWVLSDRDERLEHLL